jgi:FKBP-type peptidyl-prolyl cis-trans isomerase FklB
MGSFAQPGKPAAKPAAKPPVKTEKPLLKNAIDSVSYAIGISVASYWKMEGTKLNTTAMSKAIDDVLNNRPTLMSDEVANFVTNNYINAKQERKAQVTIKQGETFLATNKQKPGVKVTATGLQYEILKDTVGPKPTVKDTFVVHYRGSLLDGREFDNSYNRGEPLVYPLNQVIPGWTEALQLMSIGSKYKLYVPYQLGYGVYGREPTIPGGALLIFEMELVGIKRYKGTN